MWIIWVLVSAIFVEKAYPRSDREAEETGMSHITDLEETTHQRCKYVQCAWKVMCSLLWVCVVIILSFPSIAFAFVNVIPSSNTLRLSKFVANVGVINICGKTITLKLPLSWPWQICLSHPHWRHFFTQLQAQEDAADGSAFGDHVACMNGWTLFWQVCNEKSPHYQRWSMSIGDHSILEPKQDGLTLAKWLVAEKVSGDSGDTKLFLRWRISCTSNSLEHGQQASWTASKIAVRLACCPCSSCWQPLPKWHCFGVPLCLCWCQQCNMVMCKIGHAHCEVWPLNILEPGQGCKRHRTKVFAWHDLYFALLSELVCVGVGDARPVAASWNSWPLPSLHVCAGDSHQKWADRWCLDRVPWQFKLNWPCRVKSKRCSLFWTQVLSSHAVAFSLPLAPCLSVICWNLLRSLWIPWKLYLWRSLTLNYPMKSSLHDSGGCLTSNSWRSCVCCGCRKTEGVGVGQGRRAICFPIRLLFGF